MKVKEYLRKYRLTNQKFFDRKEFINDLTIDLVDYLQPMILKDHFTIPGWDRCVMMLKQKWDGIFNKSCLRKDESDPFWKYFYATVVCKLRDFYFPAYKRELDKKKQEWEKKKREKERWEEMWRRNQERERAWFNDFFENSFNGFLRNLLGGSKVSQCLKTLGLTREEMNAEKIKAVYREKVKSCHPDQGGDPDEFIKITDAKEYLLSRVEA